MPEFFDDEHKRIDVLYNRIRALLAEIDRDGQPLRSVVPQLLVNSIGTKESPEITAALIIIQVKGPTSIDALEQLESAIRIAAKGVQTDVRTEETTEVDVQVVVPTGSMPLEIEETATLADGLTTFPETIELPPDQLGPNGKLTN